MPQLNPVTVAPGVTLAGRDFVLIAGPCVIESEAHAVGLAREVAAVATRVGMPYVFKRHSTKPTAPRSDRSAGKA